EPVVRSRSASRPPSRSDDELPGRLSRLDVAMRIRCLRQRKRLADVDAKPTLTHELPAAIGALAELVVERPEHRRERDRADGERVGKERGETQGIGRAARASVEDQMSEWRQTPKSILYRRFPHGVQDEIGAAMVREPEHFVRELLRRIVDDGIGAVL